MSGNCLDGLQVLSPLKHLTTIIATDNNLYSMKVHVHEHYVHSTLTNIE